MGTALRRLLDNYAGCLSLDRIYLEEVRSGEELDLGRLESFLRARAGMQDDAERCFQALDTAEETPDRQALIPQVLAVLEEMAGLESQLSAFLEEQVRETGATIRQLRRVRPVFQRYSHLGGDRSEPNLITRRE
jgi:hypothetical protein